MLLITDYYELGSLYDFLQANVVDHEAAVSVIFLVVTLITDKPAANYKTCKVTLLLWREKKYFDSCELE